MKSPGLVIVNRRCFVVAFFISIATLSSAQDYRSFIAKADKYAAKGDHENAIANYLAAEKLNPGNAEVNYSLGKAYLTSVTQKHEALVYLEKVHTLKPDFHDEINYYLGEAYQYNHQFEKARKHYETFREKNKRLSEIVNFKIKECILGDSLISIPSYVKISNIGTEINSVFDDYSPLITADGSKFIFTSNRKAPNENTKRGSSVNYEDIYIANHNHGHWSTPVKISPNINIPFHDAAASISPDGRTLFLYYEEGAGDLYISTFNGTEWSEAKPLNKNINTTYWETSGCISADGQKLYFTSNRPGGYGELDIYMSQLNVNGDWGKAVNLGPNINTVGNEDAPFIHQNGTTLYFGSDGHVGLGAHDIFKSELVEGKWKKAENIGYPINSAEYESFFVLSADNKTGYFSSSRKDCVGNTDIYKVDFLVREPEKIKPPEEKKEVLIASTEPVVITEEIRPELQIVIPPVHEEYVNPIINTHKEKKNVTILKGKVIDEASTHPLEARITLIDNETNVVLMKVTSNPVTGDFEIVIPHGGNYGVATELRGYLFNSINFNVPNFSEYMELDTHIFMQKAEVGSKAVLKNIFFDSGKSDLKMQSLSELENIRELLNNHPEMKVQINGHTDNVGKAAFNKVLSLKRAQAVVNHLIQHGISPSRVSAVGFGDERPLVSNDDEMQGREINRRTEIEIIGGVK